MLFFWLKTWWTEPIQSYHVNYRKDKQNTEFYYIMSINSLNNDRFTNNTATDSPDFGGFRIEKLQDSHIEGVQRLYRLHIMSTYLHRLGLDHLSPETDLEEIRKYSHIEEILDIDNVKNER